MNDQDQFNIAPIVREDLPALLGLIHELASFERLEHEVQATIESLQEAFFGPKPDAGAFLARCQGQPAGYAIYFFTFSSFVGRRGLWLDDVYVRPAFRKQGVGVALIRKVAALAAEKNCGRFEWSALSWNKNALNLYEKLGAKVMDEWVLIRMNAEGLNKLATSSG